MPIEGDTTGRAPILVLGVGNRLLSDDGVGLVLLDRLSAKFGPEPGIEFVDGGTQGLALLGCLEARRAALILDAVALGAPPGTVHSLLGPEDRLRRKSSTAHESNVVELLAVASLLGQRPETVALVGIEPQAVCTGLDLSPAVQRALGRATGTARALLEAWRATLLAEPAHA